MPILSALADHNVADAIVAGLKLRGVDVLTARDLGLERAVDERLLTEATSLGRLLLTSDTDFLILAAKRQRLGFEFSGIVFWPQADRSVGEIVRAMAAYAATTLSADAANVVKFV